jgi:hypothetical protein
MVGLAALLAGFGLVPGVTGWVAAAMVHRRRRPLAERDYGDLLVSGYLYLLIFLAAALALVVPNQEHGAGLAAVGIGFPVAVGLLGLSALRRQQRWVLANHPPLAVMATSCETRRSAGRQLVIRLSRDLERLVEAQAKLTQRSAMGLKARQYQLLDELAAALRALIGRAHDADTPEAQHARHVRALLDTPDHEPTAVDDAQWRHRELVAAAAALARDAAAVRLQVRNELQRLVWLG